MKICKFCRKGTKSSELKKRVVKLPTGLPITSLDPMCHGCFNKLKEAYDNTQGNTDFREVEGASERAPEVEGRQLDVQPNEEQ